MKTVDSDALGVVNRALGITGAGAQVTEFMDGSVDQVLDVAALVRRGRTLAMTGGLFYGILRNIHPGAGTVSTSLEILNPGVDLVIDPFPGAVGRRFDLWLLGAAVHFFSGTGTMTAALFIDPPATAQAFGVDSAGAFVTQNFAIPIAFWDTVVTQSFEFGLMEDGQPYKRLGMRVMPTTGNVVLQFSTTASALASFDLQVMLGLFPVGLGQDAIV